MKTVDKETHLLPRGGTDLTS